MITMRCHWEWSDLRAWIKACEGATVTVLCNSSGSPILMLDRGRNADLPVGRDVPVMIEGSRHTFDFMKVAVNVAHRGSESRNVLPEVLFNWFGPHAGERGTDFHVRVWQEGDGWHAEPVRRESSSMASGS